MMNFLIKNKIWEINKEYNKEKLLYLLIDRPTEICNNYFVWKNNKHKDHREYDFPTIVWEHGKAFWWCKKGELHRDNNKPAIVRCNGIKEYWLDGNFEK